MYQYICFDLIQAYRMCHLKSEGRETRSKRQFLGDSTILARTSDSSKYKMIQDGEYKQCVNILFRNAT